MSARPLRILGIGGAHVDRRGRVAGAFAAGASNPGEMREEAGGGVFNALRNMARRGDAVALLSVRGGDMAGEMVARALAEAGIEDLSAVFLDRATPSFTAILDRDGDQIVGLADMGLYDFAFARQLRRSKARAAVAAADAVVIDANLPADAVTALARLADGKHLFAIAVSPAKAPRLRPLLPALACLFLNRREASAIIGVAAPAEPQRLAARLRGAGLSRAVVTAGGGTLVAVDGDTVLTADPPTPAGIADVTGAGDALAGTMASALLRGEGFAEALRAGMAAAKLCVECADAVPSHAPHAFAGALADVAPARTIRSRETLAP